MSHTAAKHSTDSVHQFFFCLLQINFRIGNNISYSNIIIYSITVESRYNHDNAVVGIQ